MADTKRRIKNEEIKKETTEPEAVSQSTAMQERMESVSRKILITARNELYMKMRFLDVALSCMPFIPDTGADGMGTDGLYLYYDPQYLGGLFREDRVMVNRIYLHLVLHGIFRHMLRIAIFIYFSINISNNNFYFDNQVNLCCLTSISFVY